MTFLDFIKNILNIEITSSNIYTFLKLLYSTPGFKSVYNQLNDSMYSRRRTFKHNIQLSEQEFIPINSIALSRLQNGGWIFYNSDFNNKLNLILTGVGVKYLFNQFMAIKYWEHFKTITKHIYYVRNISVVEPTAMYVLDTIDKTKSEFTIITCTNGGYQRLVINSYELTKEELKQLKEEDKKKKLSFIDQHIVSIENSIKALDDLYFYNFIEEKNRVIKDGSFSTSSYVRYLIKCKTLADNF